MKDQTYCFFIQNPRTSRYSLHPDISKNVDALIFMKVFGKLVANSILEKTIIGIDFTYSFIKFLTEFPHEFNDLYEEFDEVTFRNFENMGKMSEADLLSLDMNFTVFHDGKEVEIMENGSTIQVFYIN